MQKLQRALDLLREDVIEDTSNLYSEETAREENAERAIEYLLTEF